MGDPFYLQKGRTVHDLEELAEALKIMDEEEYTHHVNPERNDFAKWVEESLEKKDVAERMRVAKTKEELVKSIKEPIVSAPPKREGHAKPLRSLKKKKSGAIKEKQLQLSDQEQKETATKKKEIRKEPPKVIGKQSEELTAKELEEQRRLLLGEEIEREEKENAWRVHELSTEAPHRFIIKEFLLGAIFGLILGLILVGVLIQAGIITY